MAANSLNHEKKLVRHLQKLYTQDQIDEFNWNVDKEDNEKYLMDFVDHTYTRKHLVLDKKTSAISLKDVS